MTVVKVFRSQNVSFVDFVGGGLVACGVVLNVIRIRLVVGIGLGVGLGGEQTGERAGSGGAHAEAHFRE